MQSIHVLLSDRHCLQRGLMQVLQNPSINLYPLEQLVQFVEDEAQVEQIELHDLQLVPSDVK